MMKFLALGDSYTCGEGVAVNEAWPWQLARLLKQSQPVKIVAKTGWTTFDLLSNITDLIYLHDYDLISLQVGVNDHFQGIKLELFFQNLEKILDHLVNSIKQNSTLLVLTIPDWTLTSAARQSPLIQDRQQHYPWLKDNTLQQAQATLARYNTVIQELCLLNPRITFIDLQSYSSLYAHEVITRDYLHPNAKLYHIWARHIQAHLLKDQESCNKEDQYGTKN
ncbi:MAG: hypothetical protein KIT27_08605 [Legionellales bacterium]|nr:hypothetical protein [Legionellales bacterium]